MASLAEGSSNTITAAAEGDGELTQALLQLIAAREEEEEEAEAELPWQGSGWLEGDSLAPPCSSDISVVEQVLGLASLQPSDFLIDLGAGDGRFCLWAAVKYGVRSLGVEVDSKEAEKFRYAIKSLGLEERVSVVMDDFRCVDIDQATVLTLYLLPAALEELRDLLHGALARGTRILCITWGLTWLEPVSVSQVGPLYDVPVSLYTKECLDAFLKLQQQTQAAEASQTHAGTAS